MLWGRAGEAAVDSGVAGAARAAEVRALLEALPTCVSRDMCDNLVLSFCLVHSKGARKRMVPPPPAPRLHARPNQRVMEQHNRGKVDLITLILVSRLPAADAEIQMASTGEVVFGGMLQVKGHQPPETCLVVKWQAAAFCGADPGTVRDAARRAAAAAVLHAHCRRTQPRVP